MIAPFLRAKAATAFSASWSSQFCLSVRPSVCHTGGSVNRPMFYGPIEKIKRHVFVDHGTSVHTVFVCFTCQ